jgi:ferredoxin
MPEIHEANVLIGRVPRSFVKPLSRLFRLRPEFDAQTCVGCGVCAKACPAKAITIRDGQARLHPGPCIRCFCCHEVCPKKAVRIRKSLPLRLMARLDAGRKP